MDELGINQRIYILRCWQEVQAPTDARASWRFAVIEVFDRREQHGFGSLEELTTFLKTLFDDKNEERYGKNNDEN